MRYRGIDVSSYQGKIDWEKVKPYIDFAIIRCGYGGNLESQDDIYFNRNATLCTKLNIPFGVYLYSYATNLDDARSEVEHTLRLIKNYKCRYPIFLDVESKRQLALKKEDLVEIVDYYCSKMEENNYYTGIYSSLNVFKGILNSEKLDKYDKWVAEWGDDFTYDKEAGMWQYTSYEDISGINGRVDGDISFKNYPVIISENKLNHLDRKATLKYKVNDKVYVNGDIYTSSSADEVKEKVCNKEFTITSIDDNLNVKAPYNIGSCYGWVKEDELSLKCED